MMAGTKKAVQREMSMRTTTPAFRSPRAARLSPLAAGLALALSPAASAVVGTVYHVTTDTAATGPGTLYQAILDANANCMTDAAPVVIQFDGPFVIKAPTSLPSSGLPSFSCPGAIWNPTIDGGGFVNGADTDGFTTN